MLKKYTLQHLQLLSYPNSSINPCGKNIPWSGKYSVFMSCGGRRYTTTFNRTCRPLLQLLHSQSPIPFKPPVLATCSNSSTSSVDEKEVGKWGATVTKVIPAIRDKVWAVLADFDGIQRNFPQFFGTCETVEGEKNKLGSLRVVTTVPDPAGNIYEARERLLALDNENHTTRYFAEYNSLGWTCFEAHISCESVEDGHTLVTWTFELNPTSTTTKEEYIKQQSAFYFEVLELTEVIVIMTELGVRILDLLRSFILWTLPCF